MAFAYSLVYSESGLATEVTAKLFRAGSQTGSEITLSDSVNSFIYVGTPDVAAVAGDLAVYYRDAVPVGAEDVFGLVTIAGAGSFVPAGYVGDFYLNDIVDFMFNSNQAMSGGDLRVYINNSGVQLATPNATINYNIDSEPVTNVHHVRILLTPANYEVEADYNVVLFGATLGGETVNVVIGSFSIQNRHFKDFRRYTHE